MFKFRHCIRSRSDFVIAFEARYILPLYIAAVQIMLVHSKSFKLSQCIRRCSNPPFYSKRFIPVAFQAVQIHCISLQTVVFKAAQMIPLHSNPFKWFNYNRNRSNNSIAFRCVEIHFLRRRWNTFQSVRITPPLHSMPFKLVHSTYVFLYIKNRFIYCLIHRLFLFKFWIKFRITIFKLHNVLMCFTRYA